MMISAISNKEDKFYENRLHNKKGFDRNMLSMCYFYQNHFVLDFKYALSIMMLHLSLHSLVTTNDLPITPIPPPTVSQSVQLQPMKHW